MGKTRNRFWAVCLVFVMLFSFAVPIQAANYPYSINVKDNHVLFIRNGVVEGSYLVNNTSLTLMSQAGDLLVCFYNNQNVYKYITLGKQSSLNVSGAMQSLSLNKNLDKTVKVNTASSSSINKMQVSSASNNVNIHGKVGTLTVSSAAKVSVQNDASVGTANLTSSRSRLNTVGTGYVDLVQAANRSSVSNRGIGTLRIGTNFAVSATTNSSGLRLSAKNLYADYNDRLRDVLYDLANNVTATVGGKKVSGSVSWTAPTSTLLKRSGTYQYLFKSTNGTYGSKRGSVRIIVDDYYDDHYDYDDDIDLDIDSFTVSSSSKRLSNYTSKLNSHVKAYNDDGRRISGEAEWVLSSTRVRETDYYSFVFIPNSSRYSRIRDEIKIYVEDDYDDDDDDDYGDDEVRLETDSFHADDDDRLYHYIRDLEHNVKAYNNRGRRIYGDVEWDDEDERISGDGYYDFTFYPDDRDYEVTEGEIKIYAD